MNWKRIRCLFAREARDQIRDRRTMFTIVGLPMFLYPMMGMLMLQVAQLRTARELRFVVVGADLLPDDLVGDYLPELASARSRLVDRSSGSEAAGSSPVSSAGGLESRDDAGNRLYWTLLKSDSETLTAAEVSELADGSPELQRDLYRSLAADAILLVRPAEADANPSDAAAAEPDFEILADLAGDTPRMAHDYLVGVLKAYQSDRLRASIAAQRIDPATLRPFDIRTMDVAEDQRRAVMLWAKLLPLVMFIWALTGAFYPAIDLVAGEKERGTLETLLSGPATRREIVCGKLLAVICFSVLTAVLNLVSMQLTIAFVGGQFAAVDPESMQIFAPLPLVSVGWLLVMLLPISILFSALALAVAAMARSSKEAQYYLMPMLLVGMPLVVLPMMPGIRLSLGTALIPVSGAILLARSLVEGLYSQALLFLPLVVLVTAVSCYLATRWAIRQFETDTVLFREAGGFDLASWFHHLWRDRGAVASPTTAMLCGAIVVLSLFYARLQAGGELSWDYIVRSTVVTQFAMILAPCLIMAAFLTTSVPKALRMRRVRLADLAAAALLAISLHPTYVSLAEWVRREFPLHADTEAALGGIDTLLAGAPLLGLLAVFALVPAVCEELAFRGFIFGGLSHNRGTVRAVLVSSLLFGLSHGVLQQSISATVMGLILGLIAWRTDSVFCGIVIHACHNSASMLLVRFGRAADGVPLVLRPFVEADAAGSLAYTGNWQAVSVVLSLCLLAYFFRAPATAGQGEAEPSAALTPAG